METIINYKLTQTKGINIMQNQNFIIPPEVCSDNLVCLVLSHSKHLSCLWAFPECLLYSISIYPAVLKHLQIVYKDCRDSLFLN